MKTESAVCNFTECELCGKVRITYNGVCMPCKEISRDEEQQEHESAVDWSNNMGEEHEESN